MELKKFLKRIAVGMLVMLVGIGLVACAEPEPEAPKHEHSLEYNAGLPAGCLYAGVKDTWSCDGCEKTFLDETATILVTKEADVIIAPLGHDYQTVTGTFTCAAGGVLTHEKCSRCETLFVGAEHTLTTLNEITLPAGHKTTIHPAVTADCLHAGHNEYYTCANCDGIFADAAGANTTTIQTTAKLAHDYDQTITAVAATCTTDGNVYYRHCKTCDRNYDAAEKEIMNVTTTKLGHNTTHILAHETDCTHDGNVEYWHCSRCDKNLNATGEIITNVTTGTKLGHDMQNGTIAPTCTTDGYTTHVCLRCGYVGANTNPQSATGHTKGEWYNTKEPTCIEKGTKACDCTVCGAKAIETADIEMVDHEFDAGVDVADGKKYTCDVCGFEKVVAPNSHTLELVPATLSTAMLTCCDDGYTTDHYLCTDCGKRFKDADGEEEYSDAELAQLIYHGAQHTYLMHARANLVANCSQGAHPEFWQCQTCGTVYSDAEHTVILKSNDDYRRINGAIMNKIMEMAASDPNIMNSGYDEAMALGFQALGYGATEQKILADYTAELDALFGEPDLNNHSYDFYYGTVANDSVTKYVRKCMQGSSCGGNKGNEYETFVADGTTQAPYLVTNKASLENYLSHAQAGDTICVYLGEYIRLTGNEQIVVPANVTLIIIDGCGVDVNNHNTSIPLFAIQDGGKLIIKSGTYHLASSVDGNPVFNSLVADDANCEIIAGGFEGWNPTVFVVDSSEVTSDINRWTVTPNR